MTMLLACVSPSDSNVEETINTLKFATRALAVINHAQINREQSAAGNGDELESRQQVMDLKQQVKSLQMKCDMLTAQQLLYTRESSGSANSNSKHADTTCPRVVFSNQAATAGMLMLAASLRSVLRQNFEEDVELNEEELWMIETQVASLKCSITGQNGHNDKKPTAPSNVSTEGIDLEMGMPPILTVMETIMSLEDILHQELHPTVSAANSAVVGELTQCAVETTTALEKFQGDAVSSDRADLNVLAKEKEEELSNLVTLAVTVINAYSYIPVMTLFGL
jgi:hypothetical protein